MVYVNGTRKANVKTNARNKIFMQFCLINRPPNLRALDSLREIFVGNANKILSQSTRQRRIVSYIRISSFVNNTDSESVYSSAHN
jgi:hypothetical protein